MEQSNHAETEAADPEGMLNLSLLQIRDLGTAAERFLENALSEQEISLAEFRVLSVCATHPGSTAVEVSRVIPVDPPAVSRVVHHLSQTGLLSRRRSRTDRREVRLRVTPSGLALLAECQALLESAAAEFLETLSEAQARSFLRVITALISANS